MLLRGDRPWPLLRADDVRRPRICFVFSTIHTLNCLGLCAATQANANDPRDVRCAHATSVTRRMSLTDRHSRSNYTLAVSMSQIWFTHGSGGGSTGGGSDGGSGGGGSGGGGSTGGVSAGGSDDGSWAAARTSMGDGSTGGRSTGDSSSGGSGDDWAAMRPAAFRRRRACSKTRGTAVSACMGRRGS